MPLKDAANAVLSVEFHDVLGLHGNKEPYFVITLELAKTPTNATVDLTTRVIEFVSLQFSG